MSHWPGNPNRERTSFGGLSRGKLMSRVRSRGNTTTERRLISLLRSARLTGWRSHVSMPGHPDFVWKRERLAVFVDGCFWHGHDCGKNLHPKTNASVWRDKLNRNKARDRRFSRELRRHGWKVVRIWECHLAKKPAACLATITRVLQNNHIPRGGRTQARALFSENAR